MSDDLIEKIAKAIHGPKTWDDLCRLAAIEHTISVMARADAFRAARAALYAIEQSGTHVVVPVVATDQMEQVVWGIERQPTPQQWLRLAYAAMLSARPPLPETEGKG